MANSASLLCIVTGASRGFGKAISLQVCRQWGIERRVPRIDLVLVGRDKAGLESTATECKSIYSDVNPHLLSFDLSEHKEIEGFIEQIRGLFCRTPATGEFTEAVLFANAAALGDVSKPISACVDAKYLQKYFDLMVTSNILISSWFISELKATRKSIIFVSSLLAVQPIAGLSLYSVGKAGGHMLFRSLAAENPEVRVLVYGPGPMETGMTNEIMKSVCFESTQKMFAELKLFKPDKSVEVLFKLLRDDKYKSGDYIDIYDVIEQ